MGEDEVTAVDEIHQHGQHRALPEPRAGEGAAAALGRHGEEEPDRGDAGAEMELQVGRAPDEDVLPEGVVPPRVHRRRRDDHDDSSRGEGEAEREPEASEPEHRATEFVAAAERRAGDAREGGGPDAEAAAVDEEVGQDEERVAADGPVPRGVEVDPDHAGGARGQRQRERGVREVNERSSGPW
mgnify:CR=1 FL=1